MPLSPALPCQDRQQALPMTVAHCRLLGWQASFTRACRGLRSCNRPRSCAPKTPYFWCSTHLLLGCVPHAACLMPRASRCQPSRTPAAAHAPAAAPCVLMPNALWVLLTCTCASLDVGWKRADLRAVGRRQNFRCPPLAACLLMPGPRRKSLRASRQAGLVWVRVMGRGLLADGCPSWLAL